MSLDSREKALEIAGLALKKKAHDLRVLDMAGLVTFTDYFVICSGRNVQQVRAVVESVGEGLSKRKIKPGGVEGMGYAHWVLMDYGDVIIHVFEEQTREYYGLDKLWLDAPEVPVDENQDIRGGQDKRAVRG